MAGLRQSIGAMMPGSQESKDAKRIKEATRNSLNELRANLAKNTEKLKAGFKFPVDEAVQDILKNTNLPTRLRQQAEIYVKREIQRSLLMATNEGLKLNTASGDAMTQYGKKNGISKLKAKVDVVRKKYGVSKNDFQKMMSALVGYLGTKSFLGKALQYLFLKDKKKKNKPAKKPDNKKNKPAKSAANKNSPNKKAKGQPAANPDQNKSQPAANPKLNKKPEALDTRINRYAVSAEKQKWVLDRATAKLDYAWLQKNIPKGLPYADRNFDGLTSLSTKSGKVLKAMQDALPAGSRKLKLRLIYMALNSFKNVEPLIKNITQLKGKSAAVIEGFVVEDLKTKGQKRQDILKKYLAKK